MQKLTKQRQLHINMSESFLMSKLLNAGRSKQQTENLDRPGTSATVQPRNQCIADRNHTGRMCRCAMVVMVLYKVSKFMAAISGRQTYMIVAEWENKSLRPVDSDGK